MKKRTLYLTLFRRWFDKIRSGEKVTEFRRATSFWERRLDGKTYDEVCFRNGYHKESPSMRVEWLGCQRTTHDGEEHFAIQLGQILEVRNC